MSQKKLRRAFISPFLPNLITLFNLFTGFLSILLCMEGDLKHAAWLILICLLWDSLDGNIARSFKNPTPFGRELDSLADVVAFVLAPAVLVTKFWLYKFSPWMLFFIFLYLGCGAYRLARFNLGPFVKNSFEGLPTPAAAMTLAMSILAAQKNGLTDRFFMLFVMVILVALLSFLMVSRIPYPKFSAIQFSNWKSFFYLSIFLSLLIFLAVNVETAAASGCLIFTFLSPSYLLQSKRLEPPTEGIY